MIFNFFFKIGYNRSLSKLELSTLFERLNQTDIKTLEWTDYLFVDSDKNHSSKIERELSMTGSLVKMGEVLFEEELEKVENWKKLIYDNLLILLKDSSIDKRYSIKVSLDINTGSTKKRIHVGSQIRSTIHQLKHDYYLNIKLLPKRKPKSKVSMELSPYEYYKENMPNRGVELVCFIVKSKLIVGYTKWVTNPFDDIERDKKRPKRFFTHGTSLKMARTLVYLAKVHQFGTLLDPFCGTGTILLSALDQRINAIGIDSDYKCIQASEENLEIAYPPEKQKKLVWQLYKQDSRFLSALNLPLIDAIVTEPYLGPFVKELPAIDEGNKIMKELELLYTEVLGQCIKHLKNKGRIIIIFPLYRYSSEIILTTDYDKIARDLDLNIIKKSMLFNESLPVEIGRSHNTISRYICIFEKQSKER